MLRNLPLRIKQKISGKVFWGLRKIMIKMLNDSKGKRKDAKDLKNEFDKK